MKKLTWVQLPKPKGMFTKRSAIMVSLKDMKAVQHYSANTKIELCQCTCINGTIYLRTASAAQRDLDWGFSAKSFDMPSDEIASLVHLCAKNGSYSDIVRTPSSTTKQKQKSVVRKASTQSEGEKARKEKLLNRLLNHFKKGN